ncbi:hypothetical protein [Pedobacter jeongneungensis]|uniref:hypothetical protein n=1 Tax=Pedobacter jeongneungensis TaxID=947309 RepID=UPI00046884C2|nr:hypothetical protein [Pedobacter jeongneungensis]
MKFLPLLMVVVLICCLFFGVNAQERKGLPPSFATVTKPEMLYLTIIHNRHYRMRPVQADSLVKLGQVKDLKVMTVSEGAAIYGYRAAYGVVLVELNPLGRKAYRRLKAALEKF